MLTDLSDDQFALELLQDHRAESREMLEKMAVAVETGDYQEVKDQAHGLKGSSAVFGFKEMSKLMKQVEDEARDAVDNGSDHADSLRVHLAKLEEMLDALTVDDFLDQA
mmetsp:Transcript_25661/g.35450  ORF Transcript_25661/g.35450 Transcript_25661/m.35450 type:complete len:109 (+) Transcript_25661:197-523(+)|eukprot:CAMPEP_0196581328 /NCGR_PEP_ID=MMETSP1081-20130531/33667_1 /TAXON_ID=36882 /ORGANISM="Pyramimonas amylifera, Strain CCMP720" /LENGTH=108 /DNA_ID=CAMNT_0041901527 /DNA_START=182 /DNA_END=508 /DNA_ORIENTATION=+